MLVIRRRPGESLLIGHDVEVEILEVSGNNVKIGIRAPKEVTVLRQEVYLTSQQNHQSTDHFNEDAIHELLGTLQRSLPGSRPKVES